MSKIDMGQFGIPNISYHFSDKIRYFKRADGEKFRCNVPPGQLPPTDLDNLAEFMVTTSDELLEALLEMNEALKEQPAKTQRGTSKHVDVTWEDAIDYNAKGGVAGLKYAVIGKLMADKYIRIDDILMQAMNNIAKPISKDALTRDVLTELGKINAADLWGTKSYSLVRDHLMQNCVPKVIGKHVGYLPVKNGVVNLSTMELTHTDDIYLSCANVDYDPNSTCPSVEKLLNNAFNPDQKELVLSILGAALSGRRAPFILCLSGRGRNGKSILREMVSCLASDMITTEKIESLHKPFINQVFLGKRFIWQTEVSSKRDFTDKLKDITGGTSLTINYKYQNGQIQAEMQSVIILDTNSPPHLEDSQAINDRLRFVDMPRVFVYELTGEPNEILIDPNLAEAWREEMPGFLNLLLPYAQHYLNTGYLKFDMKVGMEQYNEKSEALDVFIRDWCDVEDGLEVSLQTFCKYYKLFARHQNVSAMPDGQIRHALRHEYDFKFYNMKLRGIRPKAQLILEAFKS